MARSSYVNQELKSKTWKNANCDSVPTQNDIAVPETILKKQKASQKATDSKAADLQKKREVR